MSLHVGKSGVSVGMMHTLSLRCEICGGVKARQKKSRRVKNKWFMCSECMTSTPPDEHRCNAKTLQKQRCKRWTLGKGYTCCAIHEGKKC